MDWQPIETAPTNGTRILVYNEMVGVYSTIPRLRRSSSDEYRYPMHG